jgi:alanyl-tRNA synthetase
MITAQDIRRSFLAYFERNGHRVVPSSPLVPHDDPTLLFTNAGMNQFKDVFLGRERREYRRATTSQKCMRVSGKHNDLDNVGPSLRHHTFFEMLGNFSFGEYFKQDAIPFAWNLLTEEWHLPADRLFATVFSGESGVPRDDEAFEVWRGFLPADHVGELGAADNFWQMGDTGPCGRCSEIYYYRGPQVACHEEAQGGCRGMECTCDRYIEIWNNVFMEFDRQADGTLNPLPAPSIDTGMGLERIAAVLQGKLSNYDTDLFTPLLAAIGERTGTQHQGGMDPSDISMRVVADHMRAMTFLIADGVVPSNEWRGYVLRKIMRRAMRHGNRLGMTNPFLHTLVDTIVQGFGDAYPELKSERDAIVHVILSEEQRFDAVLTAGLPRLEEVLERAADRDRIVPGDAAFRLYDTYGLPRDFIEDMIDDRKLSLDREGFERAMEAQREKARARSAFELKKDQEFVFESDVAREALRKAGDEFEGYTDTVVHGVPVLAVFGEDRRQVTELSSGQSGYVALSRTPFYVEAGGQVSDSGRIFTQNGVTEAEVDGVARMGPGLPRVHRVRVDKGALRARMLVTAEVNRAMRDATRRNHTATHLLHAALRQVLGPHVRQAGSLVAPDRLRFDFVHFAAVTHEQVLDIERIVNEQVLKNTTLKTEVKATQEAMAAGAMALFGEKYGERVRVVSIPDFSMELCGGTHVRSTGDIGLFVITGESGVAAGVRRIEAITGLDSLHTFQRNREVLNELSAGLNVRSEELVAKMGSLQEEVKRLKRTTLNVELRETLKMADPIEVRNVKVVIQPVSGLDKERLRALADSFRSRIKSGVVVLASAEDSKVSIVVAVTPDIVKKVPAGQVVKQIAPIVGGGGGGRPDFAEAGGRDSSKIGEMLTATRGVIEKMLAST